MKKIIGLITAVTMLISLWFYVIYVVVIMIYPSATLLQCIAIGLILSCFIPRGK